MLGSMVDLRHYDQKYLHKLLSQVWCEFCESMLKSGIFNKVEIHIFQEIENSQQYRTAGQQNAGRWRPASPFRRRQNWTPIPPESTVLPPSPNCAACVSSPVQNSDFQAACPINQLKCHPGILPDSHNFPNICFSANKICVDTFG